MTQRVLPPDEWQALEAAHEERVDTATVGHRVRRGGGRAHPVEDFLFRYYDNSPARLRRWHPGAGIVLEGAAHLPRASWPHYRVVAPGSADAVELDVDGFLTTRGSAVTFVRDLVSATVARPPHLGCFGLHEWAMVHGIPPDDVRHAGWPLRLGSAGTDVVVEQHGIRCSHFDAYRFFTDTARPRNALRPSRDGQVAMEQPGCLHASMDVTVRASRPPGGGTSHDLAALVTPMSHGRSAATSTYSRRTRDCGGRSGITSPTPGREIGVRHAQVSSRCTGRRGCRDAGRLDGHDRRRCADGPTECAVRHG